ncbi:hypothetical protein ACLOJK_021543 [Asimina triloba]
MAESKAVVLGGGEGEMMMMREYRKGNWTLHETMVLITAKKMDDERRLKREIENEWKSGSGGGSRPTELRWKWVEDYCWRNGCMRSQNQCNDRWDNLMRDYKKVRDYERRVADGRESGGNYWKLERHERKDRNLPSNLLVEIYEALAEVVERRGPQKGVVISGVVHGPVGKASSGLDIPMPSVPAPSSVPPRSPTSPAHPLPAPPSLPHAEALPLELEMDQAHCGPSEPGAPDSDGSEYSNSPSKRRRKGEGGSSDPSHELRSAISKSASILSEAMLACEEKEERRHKEMLRLEERKLRIEASNGEISMQAINALTTTINKLATSIMALVSEKASK